MLGVILDNWNLWKASDDKIVVDARKWFNSELSGIRLSKAIKPQTIYIISDSFASFYKSLSRIFHKFVRIMSFL